MEKRLHASLYIAFAYSDQPWPTTTLVYCKHCILELHNGQTKSCKPFPNFPERQESRDKTTKIFGD